ncbi:hypothetical protein CCACVL1_16207 [Corchorus capsularis]|uniref:DUF7026 domain-containing protein n=1 Tax=Corchorus capsularis TaxID=210143 RepID=A0A1R3HYC3_COCAP|nr:hypothetical protein CCACVL1_16207 [Corchorus capsularis]
MAIRIEFFSPKILRQPMKLTNHPFTAISVITNNRPNKARNITCTKGNLSDTDLALDLAVTVEKIDTHLKRKEEAMVKSKELLFSEFCQYLSLTEEEVNTKWRKLKEEDKLVLVKEFVNEWGANFHPLSARSVKEMVDEYLLDEKFSSVLFPGLKRMLGFPQDS